MSVSFLFGLLTGFLVGMICQYGIKAWLNNRKHWEQEQKSKTIAWDKMLQERSHFMNQIKTDMADPEHKNIREFFVVEPHALLNSSIPRLRYDLTEETLAAVNKLKELGYLEQLKNNCLLYKMEEDFIGQLKLVD
ncbi:hypothetical protein [Legionella fallonii]|nr:hypothetical protein [Legionella fallonii]